MKVDDKVKYIRLKRKAIVGCIGTIVATKDNNEYEEYKLKSNEALVDFGFEDDCLYVCRFIDLEVVK